MSENDLLAMLDLDGDSPPVAGGEIVTGDGLTFTPADGAGGTVAPTSPTCFQLDRWALRRGHDLAHSQEKLLARKIDEHAVADFHEAAFAPEPALLPGCTDPVRHRYLETLLETPEYQALHHDTCLNEAASELATLAFAVSYCELRDTEREREERERKGKPGEGDGKPGDGPDGPSAGAVMAAVAKGLREAKDGVDDLAEACAAMGMGPGAPGSNDPRRIAAMYRRIRNNPDLKRICELAGRYRRLAQSRQRLKTTHGVDDVVGVEMGGEIARLLPVELMRLMDDDTELDALRRIAERQAQVREHRAVEPVGRGPIMLVIDESGSMRGEKVHTAKAIGLALAWVARQQRRWCAFGSFADTGSLEQLLPLKPECWSETALIGWLEAFLGGGTNYDDMLTRMPDAARQLRAPRGKTDVIIITDGQSTIEPESREAFLAWKRAEQVRVTTLVIESEPGEIGTVSDVVHQVDSLSVEEEAVGAVLSV